MIAARDAEIMNQVQTGIQMMWNAGDPAVVDELYRGISQGVGKLSPGNPFRAFWQEVGPAMHSALRARAVGIQQDMEMQRQIREAELEEAKLQVGELQRREEIAKAEDLVANLWSPHLEGILRGTLKPADVHAQVVPQILEMASRGQVDPEVASRAMGRSFLFAYEVLNRMSQQEMAELQKKELMLRIQSMRELLQERETTARILGSLQGIFSQPLGIQAPQGPPAGPPVTMDFLRNAAAQKLMGMALESAAGMQNAINAANQLVQPYAADALSVIRQAGLSGGGLSTLASRLGSVQEAYIRREFGNPQEAPADKFRHAVGIIGATIWVRATASTISPDVLATASPQKRKELEGMARAQAWQRVYPALRSYAESVNRQMAARGLPMEPLPTDPESLARFFGSYWDVVAGGRKADAIGAAHLYLSDQVGLLFENVAKGEDISARVNEAVPYLSSAPFMFLDTYSTLRNAAAEPIRGSVDMLQQLWRFYVGLSVLGESSKSISRKQRR